MEAPSNRATRYVYLRTLPLASEPALDGESLPALALRIEDAARAVCERHLQRVRDDRAAVHVHTAALAVATHSVVGELVRNDRQLANMIRAGFGAPALPAALRGDAAPSPGDESEADVLNQAEQRRRPDYWIVRAALWFAFDKFAAIRRMTRNMADDFGAAFETRIVDDEAGGLPRHTLFVCKSF